MSVQGIVVSPEKSAAEKWQGALLLLSVVVALVVSVGQISVITQTIGFAPIIQLRSVGLGPEMVGLAASLVALALAFRQGRLRVAASLLTAAATLPIYFHNLRGTYQHPILPTVLPFPPVPAWVAPTFASLAALGVLAVLVSLWRHKHDPIAAF